MLEIPTIFPSFDVVVIVAPILSARILPVFLSSVPVTLSLFVVCSSPLLLSESVTVTLFPDCSIPELFIFFVE